VKVFSRIETYVVSLLMGVFSHWVATHHGVMDPFVSGTLAGAILHGLGLANGQGAKDPPVVPPRVGGSV
jgi:hypothetical protein